MQEAGEEEKLGRFKRLLHKVKRAFRVDWLKRSIRGLRSSEAEERRQGNVAESQKMRKVRQELEREAREEA